MSLQIIGAGFGRTGTMSTYTALNKLGYNCYHMIEVLQNKENKTHLDFWNKVADAPAGTQHNWDEAFENYSATVDNPGCCVWKELLEVNPDAKVILTLHPRGPEAWYESTIDTIYFTEVLWQFKILKALTPFGKKMGNMSSKLIWQRSLKGTMDDKQRALARYQEHIEEVKAGVPAENLLIFQVTEGWEPLCNFLGKEVPDGEFPNVNDRKDVKKIIADITKGAYVFIGIGAVLLLAVIFGLVYFFG